MLFYCMLCIIIGVVLFLRAKLDQNVHARRRQSYILSFVFFGVGLGMLIARFFLPVHIQYRLWAVFAGGLLVNWGSIGIKDLICCKWMVSAVCLDVTNHSSIKHGKIYTPKFRYQYQRRTYEKESQKSTEKANKFKKGQIYSVFINEKHPERVIWRKKIDFEDIFLVFMGVVIWVTCIFA